MNRSIGLWILVALAGYLSFLVLQSYWQYIVFAALFAILCSPLHRRLQKRLSNSASATLLTIGVVLLIVIPSIYIAMLTLEQAPHAYDSALSIFNKDQVKGWLGVSAEQVKAQATALGERLRQDVLSNAGSYLTQASDVLVGIGIMFLTTFFLLRDGGRMVRVLVRIAPVQSELSERFLHDMNQAIRGVILGQVVTALVQGVLVGILFAIAGLPNPLFWGVVATLLSVIPILGPFLVYIPAGVYLIVEDRYAWGIFLILFGTIVISQVDNFIRPYIMNRATHIHPLIPILGVIGGLKLWGFPGFVLGPLALAAFITLIEFATAEEVVDEKKVAR